MPSSAFLAKLADPPLDLGEAQAIGVAQHRHDQPFGGADRDADVVVVLEHHLVALDLGVDPRERLAARRSTALTKNEAMPRPTPWRSLNDCLVALAQRHHRRHVDFVEGGEHRGGALRLDQPPAMVARRFDMRTRSSVRSPVTTRGFSATGGAGLAAGASATGPARVPARREPRVRAGAAAACSTSRLITRPASPLPRTLVRSTSCSSAAFRAVGVARGALRRRRPPAPARLRVAGRRGAAAALAGGGCRAARRGVAGAGVLDHAQHLADLDVLAILPRDLRQHAGLRRADLEIDLVGLELDQRVAGGDLRRLPGAATWRCARRRSTRRPRERRCWRPCVLSPWSERSRGAG